MPIPLPIAKFLIRTGVAQRLPSIRKLLGGGVDYLHQFSDAVLMAPNTEVAATEALFACRGPDALDLSLGAPQFDALGLAPEELQRLQPTAAGQGLHSGPYPPPAGLPELRAAVAEKLQRDNALSFSPEREVVITSGVCQALTMVLDTFVNPGDPVVLFDPSFMLYQYALRWQRARIRWVPTRLADGEILFDPARLSRALRGAKLVLVNTPSNPTGGVFSTESLERIVHLARRRDALIFSDEVYERFLYDGRPFVSLAALPGARPRTITANSLSKSFGMAALRVGYLAAPESLMRPIIGSQFIRCPFVSTPCQHVALAALRLPADAFHPVLREFDRRRRRLHGELDAIGLETTLPAGAFYFWIDVTRHAPSGMHFTRRLLDEQNVLVLPGTDFGPGARRHVRISYAGPTDHLEQALPRLARFVQTPSGANTSSSIARPHTRRTLERDALCPENPSAARR